MKTIFVTVVLVLPCFLAVRAQNQTALQRKIAKLEAQGHILEAAQLHISSHDDGEREASIKASMTLYKLGKYKESLYYFQHADSMGTLDHEDEVIAYLDALKAHQRYQDADALIATHMNILKDTESISVHENQISNYTKFLAYKNSRISILPINTIYSEFGPSVLNGWLYFESTRLSNQNKGIHGLNNQSFYNLYLHPLGDPSANVLHPKGHWGKPQVQVSSGTYTTLSIPADINQSHHDAPVYLSPNGKHLFYTSNWDHNGKESIVNPHLNLSYSAKALENSQKIEISKIHLNLYYSTNTNNIWSVPIPFPYNNDAWSNQHAYFEEKTSTLYYSSNMPGGKGGFDIWKSVLHDGKWSEPENLGDKVNTPRNEIFPVRSPEGYFIFASNGWPGLGGIDLFMVDDPLLPPLNMLAGVNTEMDDFGMNFYDDRKGYFVSNRKESVGDDDIFEFEINFTDIIDYHRPSYQLILVNALTGEKIAGSVVVTEKGNSKTIQVGVNGLKIHLQGHEANFSIAAEGYLVGQATLSGETSSREIVIRMQPVPVVKETQPEIEVINVDPVYFSYNKSNIRKDAADALRNLHKLLEKNQDAKIMLMGHTDTRGATDYNDELSRKRVESARRWLESRGVSADRIQTGFQGEKQPTVVCEDAAKTADPDKCLNEKQHQLNRRVAVELQKLK